MLTYIDVKFIVDSVRSKLTSRIWNTNCKYNIFPSLQPKSTCVITFFVILI